MIKDFFIKKENIFIALVAIISIFFVVLGFLFLFLRTSTNDGPRDIPNSLGEVTWKEFNSKIISQKIMYPEYLYVKEQKEQDGSKIMFAEFESADFLTHNSNQNHISIYPQGTDNPFFYAKTRETQYMSDSNQEYARTEYLTLDNDVWAIKLVPKLTPKDWLPRGFILIESKIRNRVQNCQSGSILLTDIATCDPYQDQKIVYSGELIDDFLNLGYKVIHKNIFK